METNKNQTSIPMKKQFPLRWIFGTIAAFLIIGLWFISTGNAEQKYIAKYPVADNQVSKLIRNTWCPLKKEAALAKLEDDNHGVKYQGMNRDQTALYRDMDCSKIKVDITVEFDSAVSWIPTAKALSFDESNFSENSNSPQVLHPIHKGSLEQQKYIDYAWNTYHDKNLIYLMKAENGLITPDRKHSTAYYCPKKKGVFHDWGFGGISDCYHSEITKDPRFFSDPYWQIDQVYRLYKGGTRFASRKNWPKMAKYFDWVY